MHFHKDEEIKNILIQIEKKMVANKCVFVAISMAIDMHSLLVIYSFVAHMWMSNFGRLLFSRFLIASIQFSS